VKSAVAAINKLDFAHRLAANERIVAEADEDDEQPELIYRV
jgi:hypothetical protein